MMLAAALAQAPGCFGERPADMLEIAQFEELQRNYPHAREIYTRLLAKFPDSPEANIARERLDALDAADTESP